MDVYLEDKVKDEVSVANNLFELKQFIYEQSRSYQSQLFQNDISSNNLLNEYSCFNSC